ncbi:OmpP1/FadL family transporter [Candidatus Latescibacterota bacterium]
MNRTFKWEDKTMKRILITAIITALFGMVHISHAQEIVTENNIVAGARALGMGGAQIAAAGDATAVIHNPAALARIENLEFQLGLNMLKREIKTNLRSNFAHGSGSASDDFSGLGTIGVAYPVSTDRGSLVFALAYNRVKNFSGIFKSYGYNDYAFEVDNEIWGGNETSELVEEGGLGVISLASAVDVSPSVSVGASIDVWTGRYKIDKRILRNDTPGEVSWLDITGGEDDITAWSFKPSILYFKENFRLGAFMRFPMTFHINQKNYDEYYSRNDGYFFHIHETITPYSGADYLDDNFTGTVNYKIKAPMQVGMGFSLGKPGKSLFALDVEYENWEKASFEDEYDPYYFSDKYRSTLNWRVGYEQKLPFFNTVGRIGYMRQPVTFKGPRGNDPGDPQIDVVNMRDYLTLGFSKQFDDGFSIDLGYAHGFWSVEEGNREDKESHDRVYVAINYRVSGKLLDSWQEGK